MRLKVIISLLLAGITLAIYWPASHFTLFGRDDPLFILSPEVSAGFSPAGINWVIKGVVAANWHPVTTFSFLFMHELFGLNPGAEHLVNVFFHAANAALLFLVLVEMMGGLGSPGSRVRGPESKSLARPHPGHLPQEREKQADNIQNLKGLSASSQGKKENVMGGAATTPCGGEVPLTPALSPKGEREDNGRRGSTIPTEKVLCCAVVAGIFAWHPLHVESVAWISERKDVLFTFFMLLSLWCYVRYARGEVLSGHTNTNDSPSPLPSPAGRGSLARPHPSPFPQERENNGRRSSTDGGEVPLTPTLSPKGERENNGPRGSAVPTPFLSGHGYYNLALLFFILSFLCKATVVTLPFLLLLLDFWPLHRLNRGTLRRLIFEKWRFFALAILFCVITFSIHKNSADVESLAVFGIKDRMENVILSYVSYLGKFFWPTNLAIIYPYPRNFDTIEITLAALLLLAISALCLLQISRRPYLAAGWFWYLGTMVPVIGLVQIGLQGMADRHTYISLIGPTFSLVWLMGDWVRTASFWKYPVGAATAVVLAVCVVLTARQLQLWKDTVTLFRHTVALGPDNALAECTLALGLEHEGHLRQAAVYYRIALSSHAYRDEHYLANFYLADMREKAGFYQDAEAHLEAALQDAPGSTDTMNNLAWVLATAPNAKARDGARAVQWAEKACELTHEQNPTYLTTLAAADAEAGRFDDAVATTQNAITLANEYGLDSLAEGNQELLQTYSAHQTYAQTHPGRP